MGYEPAPVQKNFTSKTKSHIDPAHYANYWNKKTRNHGAL